MVEANVRVVSGVASIDDERKQFNEDNKKREPTPFANAKAREKAREWAAELFGRSRVPQ